MKGNPPLAFIAGMCAGFFGAVLWTSSPVESIEPAAATNPQLLTAAPGQRILIVPDNAKLIVRSTAHGVLHLDAETVEVQGIPPSVTPLPPELPPKPGPVEVPTTPPAPPVTTPVTQATFVYEKSKHPIPSGVAAAMSKLVTEKKLAAGVVDQDVVNRTGQMPAQYAVAIAEAKKVGLPCLVVQAGNVVLRTVRDPKTEAQVLEAVK